MPQSCLSRDESEALDLLEAAIAESSTDLPEPATAVTLAAEADSTATLAEELVPADATAEELSAAEEPEPEVVAAVSAGKKRSRFSRMRRRVVKAFTWWR